jgi:proliferating cell nuclear antigen
MNNAKSLYEIFNAVSGIVSETRIRITPEELGLTALDGSHICLVDLHLKKEDCDVFECKKEHELGINLQDLTKILKRAKANDQLTIIDGKDKKLALSLKTENAKKERKFTMACIDIEYEPIDMKTIMEMEFHNSLTFNLTTLTEAMADAELFGDVLTIHSTPDLLRFTSEGTMGDMEYVIEKEEFQSSELTENTEGGYSIQYLKNILKILSLKSIGELKLKSDHPFLLKLALFNNSSILYMLAPRVEEDTSNEYEEDE